MKPIIQVLSRLLAVLIVSPALAQTPTLEFASGAGNPAAGVVGPTIANQVITFQNNTDNPTGTTFAAFSPTTTATFSLSNQVPLPVTRMSTGTSEVFGAAVSGAAILAPASPVFPLMNAIGGAADGNFVAANGLTNGINIATNRAVEMFVSTEALAYNAPTNVRYQFGDLTITFNRPVTNPVIHLVGLGGTTGGVAKGITTEMDLLTAGVTMSKLDGSTELVVSATQIENNAALPGPVTGSGAASGSILVTTPATGITTLTFRLYMRGAAAGEWHPQNNNTQHNGDQFLIGVSALATTTITGLVFEDVNYGGGGGRPSTATGASLRQNARVELYNSSGVFVASTTTNASGRYTFTQPPGDYTVRVVNNTVTSSRTGYTSAALPVMTYNGSTDRVGGEAPQKGDAPNGAATNTLTSSPLFTAAVQPQSIAAITAAVGSSTGPDFGFNFSTIVNRNDTGIGSLRQFLTNAALLGGEASLAQAGSNSAGALPAQRESSIFMIPDGLAHPGLRAYNAGTNPGLISQLTGGVAIITPNTATNGALPAISGAATNLDATTQTFNVGNTNNVTLGTGGTVGTNATALSQLNGPEVQLVGTPGTANSDIGLDITNNNITIRGLSIYGFGNTQNNTAGANIRVTSTSGGAATSGTLITGNLIGTAAATFPLNGVDPNTLATRSTGNGIYLGNGTALGNPAFTATISNNLIGYNGTGGIENLVTGISGGVNTVIIEGNEIRGNAILNNAADGTRMGLNGGIVRNNLYQGNQGPAVDFAGSTGNVTVFNNTISNNGLNGLGQTPGIRMLGTANTVSQNIISNNYGAGILAQTGTSNSTFSQNSIFGNGTILSGTGAAATGQIGIDLLGALDNADRGTAPFVTVNDNLDADIGGNSLLNFPVMTTASIAGGNITVTGYARPGSVVEFFIAAPDASGFGEGQTYLVSRTEGAAGVDTNAGTGSYSGVINGKNQGADNTNLFTFTLPFASLTAAQQTAVLANGLTATATIAGTGTSEFSGTIFPTNIAGTVFEDANYGGGAGRSLAASSGVARSGARVELYDAGGNFVSFTTTNGSGQYSFNVAAGDYTVRVVNNTVTSARTGTLAGTLAVGTYAGNDANAGNRVGGFAPEKGDAVNGSNGTSLASLTTGSGITAVTPMTRAAITVGSAGQASVDFGFNFSTIVNTNNTGLGSLRQFITNANNLTGEASLAQAGSNSAGALPTQRESSIFMIPDGLAHPGLLASGSGGPISQLNASGVAVITPTTALLAISGAGTFLDATTQTFNVGNTNNVTLGTGGTVGTSATALSQLNGPEVQIVGTAGQNVGVDFTAAATNSALKGVSVYGFGAAGYIGGTTADVRVAASGFTLSQNVVGATATSFTNPAPAGTTRSDLVYVSGAGITVTNNLLGFSTDAGLSLASGANGATITNNEIVGAGRLNATLDGIPVVGTGATISGNLIAGNFGPGIELGSAAATATISNNTVSGNGRGTATAPAETAGIRLASTGTIISNNAITGNYGNGIEALAATSASTFTQNSIYGNGTITATNGAGASGGIGIDLQADGVTINDNNDGDGGANGRLNFPVLTSATIVGTNLVVTGYARAGSVIELFAVGPVADPTGFGEGQTYLISRTEGSADDTDGGNANYGPGAINGLLQGQDNTARNFSFTIPLGSLPISILSSRLSATATLAGATSEFSGNVFANTPAVYTVAPPKGGTGNMYQNGDVLASVVDADGGVVSAVLNAGPLPAGATLNPVTGLISVTDRSLLVAGSYPLTITTTDAFGAVTVHNIIIVIGGSPIAVTDNAITPLNTPVTFAVTANDLANGGAAIDPATIDLDPSTAGIQNTITVTGEGTFTTVGAPAGSVTFTPANATFTGVVNVPYLVQNTLGAYSNQANLVVNVETLPIDLSTTIAAGTNPVNAGGSETLTMVVTNNGTTTATGVVETVRLPLGLTAGSFTFTVNGSPVTTGYSYSATTGVVTFAAQTIPAGGSVTLTATFTAPTSGPFTATAQVGIANTADPVPANNAASVVIDVTPRFDLLTLISGPTSVVTGNLATFTVITRNQGTSVAPAAVQTVQLPTGLTGVFATNGGSYNSISGVVTFPAIELAAGQVVNNTVSFAAPAAGFTASSQVTPNTPPTGDTTPGNNNSNATPTTIAPATGTPATSTLPLVGTVANLNVGVSGPALVTPGQTGVTYTVTQENNGPTAASNVVTQVSLPLGLTAATLTVNGVTGAGGATINFVVAGGTASYVAATGVLTLPTIVSQASAASTSYTIALTAPATGDDLTVVASTRSATTDPVSGDNVASVVTMLSPTTDVATTLTGVATVAAGQPITYAVRTVNNSANEARQVQQSVAVVPGLTAAELQLNGVSGTLAGNTISFTLPGGTATYNTLSGEILFPVIPSLAGNNVQSNNITLLAQLTSPMRLYASVSTATPETNMANNAVYASNTVTVSQDVQVRITGPAQAVVGNSVLYAVTVTNNGPSSNNNQVTTVQLPTGLSGVVAVNAAGATIAGAYNATTGVVTLTPAAVGVVRAGESVVYTLSFNAPDVVQLNLTADVDPVSPDANPDNNTASVSTAVVAPDLTTTDLGTVLTRSPLGNQPAGSAMTFTVTTTNLSTNPAANVVQTVVLPAGLTNNGNSVVVSGGGSYNNLTGVVTFPVEPSLIGTGVLANTITISLPGNPSNTGVVYTIGATATASTATLETNQANNSDIETVVINPFTDVATAISGPATAVAGATVFYAIQTISNGPTASTVAVQTFTLPAGVTAYSLNGAAPIAGSGLISLPAASVQAGTSATNIISFTAPATSFTVPVSVSNSIAETNVANNTASVATAIQNVLPVAVDVVNTLQSPRGATSNTSLDIDDLAASDADGTVQSYTITALPLASQGVLYVNGVVLNNANFPGLVLTPTQAGELEFDPATTFVGNANFSYFATDNAGGVSNVALYTINVARDNASVYTNAPVAGGLSPYTNGQAISNVFDPNGGTYSAAGAETDNGVRNAVLASGTMPAGTALDPNTGQIYVSDRNLLVAGPYSVNITTTDAFGGVTTQLVNFIIGNNPLPVELTTFTAQAVGNVDGLLKWTTASERDNARFEVERSLDGRRFDAIGQVAGQGTSAQAHDYTLTDAGIGRRVQGTVYYRLKQVDRDGTFAYSPVRTVAFSKQTVVPAISLYPNPATSTTTLDLSQLPTGTYQVSVLDATGRVILGQQLQAGLTHSLDLREVASGSYTLLVRGSANGEVVNLTKRLIKE